MRLDTRIMVLIAMTAVMTGIFLNMRRLAHSNQSFAVTNHHNSNANFIFHDRQDYNLQHHRRTAASPNALNNNADQKESPSAKAEEGEEFERGVVHATLHKQGLSHMAFHHSALQLELADLVGGPKTIVIVGVEWGNDLMAFATAGYRVIAFEPMRKYYDLVRKRLQRYEHARRRRIRQRRHRQQSGHQQQRSRRGNENGPMQRADRRGKDDMDEGENDEFVNNDQYGNDTLFSTMKLTQRFVPISFNSNEDNDTGKMRQLNVVLHNLAAGNETGGETTIHYRNVSTRVRLSRVDDAVHEPARLLSVDIQGAELSVLQGATDLFGQSPQLSMVWTEAIACNPQLPGLLSLLDAFDFAVFDFALVGTPLSTNTPHNHSWTHLHNFVFQPDRPSTFPDYLDWLCAQKRAAFNVLQTDFVAIRRDILSPQAMTRLANIADTICTTADSRCVLRNLLSTPFHSPSPSS